MFTEPMQRGMESHSNKKQPTNNALRRRFAIAVILALALIAANMFAGCGKNPATAAVKPLFRPSPDKDVTKVPSYNFSSFAGTIWKTKTKTAIADIKIYTGAHNIA